MTIRLPRPSLSRLEARTEKLITRDDEFSQAVLNLIQNAKDSIIVEFYIFEPGLMADRLVDALCKRASVGVNVQVLIDAFGSPRFSSNYKAPLQKSGARVRSYNRIQKYISRFSEGRLSFAKILSLFNRRNHRKLIIADEEFAIIGSFNIDDRHSKEIYGEDAWRDLAVIIQSADVRYLSTAARALFKRKIFRWWKYKPEALLINQGPGSALYLRKTINLRLRSANKRIWIQNPYFAPIRSIFDTLIFQARRGVDVQIIVPKKSDIFFMRWISYFYFRKLIREGIKVFEYEPTFSHQKVLQIDDRAFVGSLNFNHRSFLFDLEVEVEILDPANRKTLETRFLGELQHCTSLRRHDLDHPGFIEKILSRIFLLIRYWC